MLIVQSFWLLQDLKNEKETAYKDSKLLQFVPSLKPNKCIKKFFQKILECCSLFVITTKLRKCMKKLLIINLMQLEYAPDYYMTKEVSKKAVHTYLSALMHASYNSKDL